MYSADLIRGSKKERLLLWHLDRSPGQARGTHSNEVSEMHSNEVSEMHSNGVSEMHSNRVSEMHSNGVSETKSVKIEQKGKIC